MFKVLADYISFQYYINLCSNYIQYLVNFLCMFSELRLIFR